MAYKNLLVNTEEKISIVTINRPDKLNVLNAGLIAELKDYFTGASADENISVIIITGAGPKAFAAGADINEIAQLRPQNAKEFAEEGQTVFNLIENSRKPVIAAVNGFALGGGCELALACHIRIASENAKFGQPEINLALIPGYGGTQRLTRLINPGRAAYYILTGNMIDSSEALRLGIVSSVYPPDKLIENAVELAKKIASKSLPAVGCALDAINAAVNLPPKEGFLYEASLFQKCCSTEDFREGTSSFIEKREGKFKNK